MIKCKYCGAELVDSAKFCTACGNPVESEVPNLVHEPVYESVSYNDAEFAEEKTYESASQQTASYSDAGSYAQSNAYANQETGKDMNFIEAIVSVFTNYANFKGRARRKEFWYFFLLNTAVTGALNVLGSDNSFFTALTYVWTIGTMIPYLALCWRRLHDIGYSGKRWFFCLIPFVGWVVVLVWYATKGEPYANEYGPVVK